MKKNFISVIFVFAFYFAHAQNDSTWYKVYTGKIGNMEATIHLCRAGANYSGYVWFKQLQWPMQIIGSQNITNTDSIQLSAINGPASLNLTGVFNENNFNGSGTFEQNNASKTAHFQMSVNTGSGFTPFNYFYAEGQGKLPAKLKNESTCEYSSGTIWPKNNNVLSALLKKEIGSLLKIKTVVSNPQVSMNNTKNQFIAGWLKDNNKLTPKEASEMGMSLSASQDGNIMVMYEDTRSITLANLVSEYTGGAHNNYATFLYNFDKKSGRRLLLKDILTPEGIKALPSYLDRAARMQYQITNQLPLDQNNFFVKVIKPSENFYITDAGIGFLYDPYAIKSFADGEINLLIPVQAIAKYLQPQFRN